MLREVAFSDAGVGSMGLSIGADIPIQGIRGDQQAGLFGQTCFEPKLAKNTLGTAGVYSMNTGLEPPVTDGLSTVVACGSKCGATYMTEGVASCASTTTR